MAKSTVEAFNQFYERIKPSQAIQNIVAERKARVSDILKRAFPSTSDLRYQSSTLIGSLGRQTASQPVGDMDLLVHIHVDQALWQSSYQHDSRKFLYRIRTALNATSTVQKIGARGQAVRLFYSDGLTVDVAAVEKFMGDNYGIPDGRGGWLATNPIRHAEYLNQQSRNVAGDLKHFIQIVKQWNHAHSSRLSSFHLEMLAARTFSSLGNDRRKALEEFFDHNWCNLSVQDPAGNSGDLSNYLTLSKRQAVNDSLAAARDRARAANRAELSGDHREAIRLWQIILGSDFPAYG